MLAEMHDTWDEVMVVGDTVIYKGATYKVVGCNWDGDQPYVDIEPLHTRLSVKADKVEVYFGET